jgi:hypothetical protein
MLVVVGAMMNVGDPSHHLKALFRKVVKKSLIDIDVTDFPIFEGCPHNISVIFGITDMTKDIDSLLKFIMGTL